MTMIPLNITTSICGLKLNTCMMNASGCWCTTEQELNDLQNSKTGAIISKSSTILPRNGNLEPRLYLDTYGSINSMGIPNLGYEFYMNYGNTVKTEKQYIQSIYPFSPDELRTMLINIDKTINGVRLIEINLSCPNLINKKETHNFDLFNDYLSVVGELTTDLKNIIIGVKLPPFYELNQYEIIAELLLKCKIKFITCINSVVNGLIIDLHSETTRIVPKHGLGGIGGVYCKPVGLANVYNFYRLLGDKIDIIGCGGVKNGADVFEYILCGAKAVQIGTQLVREDPRCFDRINDELMDIMKEKGYGYTKGISEFRGKIGL